MPRTGRRRASRYYGHCWLPISLLAKGFPDTSGMICHGGYFRFSPPRPGGLWQVCAVWHANSGLRFAW